jgi:hypothetical protein
LTAAKTIVKQWEQKTCHSERVSRASSFAAVWATRKERGKSIRFSLFEFQISIVRESGE